MNLFVTTLQHNPFYYGAWVLIVMFSICVHEYAHAAMAMRQGDDTAAEQGHLSLNPLVQMGLTSIIMLLLIGIAWGAVPVDVRRMRGHAAAALVAFAGPAANLVLCLVFGGLAVLSDAIFSNTSTGQLASAFFTLGSVANGVLFLFNMLPIPMFDGWPIFSLFIPRMAEVDVQQAQSLSFMLLLVVWITPVKDLIWGGGSMLAGRLMAAWSYLFALVT